MSRLVTTRKIAQPDDAYEMLLAAHEGLSRDESEALNARLILTLINHIGDPEVLREALEIASLKE
ncbi:hypothetical protein FIU97_08540 [Roseivivax sp. THAF40]|uniref:DUF2783 domain-containing protein n=1 Tax=unclassified Roseivivax TaxID=2639302 RepID=UPI001268E0D4|nr:MULTISPECIES: DUF2783 domain-containing protein [unclassified Roseivivax]QFS82846.1 hypothetical protein FIV09_08435 [Roseivivax sp. THAF197b]QFT46615.1 hypothetical protein FIU97_08540 [Roseivivax sp. THAF40]